MTTTKGLGSLGRRALVMGIDEILPAFAEDKEAATEFARTLLEDILEGRNKDLKGRFLAKVEELGIDLESS